MEGNTMAESEGNIENAETPEVVEAPEADGDQPRLTQAEVDRIVEQRLSRERRKYADYEDLQSKASEYDALVEAQKTEFELEQEARVYAEERASEAEGQVFWSNLHSELLAEATSRNLVDPDGAIAFLVGADSELLDFEEDGTLTNVAEAMDELLERRAYLAGSGRRSTHPSADQGARGGNARSANQLSSVEGLSPEQIVKALENGQLDSYLKN